MRRGREVNGYKDKDKQKYIVIMKRDQRVRRQSHKKRKDIHIMRRGGRSTGTLRITAYLDQLSFAPMDHVAATPRHNHHHLHHHCIVWRKWNNCVICWEPIFWSYKIQTQYNNVVGPLWPSLKTSEYKWAPLYNLPSHFKRSLMPWMGRVCKVFFMDEQSSGMRLLGSKWSRRAFTKWWDSVRECVHQLAVENIQRLFKKYSKNIQSESEHQLSVENIQRMERNFEKVEAAGKLADSWIVNFQTLHLEERS